MKRVVILALLSAMAFTGRAQNLQASLSGPDRMTVVKSSIDIPVWHEKSFWSLYDDYLQNHEQVASLSYRALDDVAKIDKSLSDQEAFDHAKKLLAYRYDELAVKTKYFTEVGSGFNGIIALQFLQTEVMLDMVESSRIYEETTWRNFRFHPRALASTQSSTAKYNTITAALSLTPEQADVFYKIYARYEEECSNMLGDDYDMYGLYAGEPTDFTPALAKRQGHNLLELTKRELKLKEKYFLEMNTAAGSSVASRFLAWEDYYSLVSKMYAWTDN
jgi:hypothetical protein